MNRHVAFLLAGWCSLSLAGCGGADWDFDFDPISIPPPSPHLVVMSRNIYVGADVDRVLAAESPEAVPGLVSQTFQELLSTNFPVRAVRLADEIQHVQPHLIGLQEVSTIRLQSPGDAIAGGTIPAEEVLFDYLEILIAELLNRGLEYRVAGSVQNADVELPMVVSLDPLAFDDVRLTDYDVVLARRDVAVANVVAVNYEAALPVAQLGIEIPRGYVAVDATVNDRTYRFASTHLEPFSIEIQMLQAAELLAHLEGTPLYTIVVGDLNSPAPDGETYTMIQQAAFVDAWTQNLVQADPEGFTFGHASDLRNTEVLFTMRVDFIFMRSLVWVNETQDIGLVRAEVVGEELEDRILDPVDGTYLWPSDHGGVVARLLKEPNAD